MRSLQVPPRSFEIAHAQFANFCSILDPNPKLDPVPNPNPIKLRNATCKLRSSTKCAQHLYSEEKCRPGGTWKTTGHMTQHTLVLSSLSLFNFFVIIVYFLCLVAGIGEIDLLYYILLYFGRQRGVARSCDVAV